MSGNKVQDLVPTSISVPKEMKLRFGIALHYNPQLPFNVENSGKEALRAGKSYDGSSNTGG